MTTLGINQTHKLENLFSTGSVSSFTNSGLNLGGINLFELAGLIEQYNAEGTTEEQKNSIILGFIQQVPSLFEKGVELFGNLLGNIKSKATSDVKETDENTNKAANEVSEVVKANNAKLDEILTNVNATVEEIKGLLTTIETETTTTQSLQEQLKAKQNEIEENKKILNDSASNENEKTNALARINEIAGEIGGLLTTVEGLAEFTKTQQSQINTYQEKVVTDINSAESVINENLAKIGITVAKTSAETAKSITIQNAEGTQEIATGTALEAAAGTEAAAGIFTFGVSTAASVETQRKALDYIAGGNIHIGGSAANMTNLTAALGKMGTDASLVANEMQMVGSASANAARIIGEANTKLDGIITAVGSWTESNISGAKSELEAAVNDYQQKLNTESEEHINKPTESTQNAGNNTQPEMIESNNNLKFEFDSTKLNLKIEQA